MRIPNPREGIHGSPRIARIARISAKRVCGDRRAIWLEAVHRWLLTRRRYKIIGLVWRLKFGDHCTKICQLALFQVDSQIKYHKQYYRQRDGNRQIIGYIGYCDEQSHPFRLQSFDPMMIVV